MEPGPGAEAERIEELARFIEEAACGGDVEAVSRALAARRAILARLPSGGAAVEILRALESCRTGDAAAAAELARRRDEIREELVALGRGRRGLSGYWGGASAAGKRIDERR